MKKQLMIFLLVSVLSACGSPAPARQTPAIEVTDAWVRAVGSMNNMSSSGSATALFMTIQNNSSVTDKLLNVKSDAAKMVQIHLSEVDANGVSSMHEVDGVEIPAGGTAELKPGGYHVMLMGLNQDLKAGDQVAFTLTFQNAGSVTVEAQVKTP
ncbi:MAG TPA: copper chaperone PCu(A)C [Anaerolineales bacterium]|nr:copper chaperone PCu(A)C [Anaerolineales bacterium]